MPVIVSATLATLTLLLTESTIRGRGDDSEINWNAVQPYLDEAPCDVAQILDCCYAGNAIKTKAQGRNEILAACGRDVTTPSGPNSYINGFTAVLTQIITEAKPFSLLTVHERIKAATKRRNDDIERQSPQTQRNDAVLEPISLPVYKLIPESSDSITLRPKVLAISREHDHMPNDEASQDDDGLLGCAYAKLAIHKGDDQKDWKDVGFTKILTAEEVLEELQGGA